MKPKINDVVFDVSQTNDGQTSDGFEMNLIELVGRIGLLLYRGDRVAVDIHVNDPDREYCDDLDDEPMPPPSTPRDLTVEYTEFVQSLDGWPGYFDDGENGDSRFPDPSELGDDRYVLVETRPGRTWVTTHGNVVAPSQDLDDEWSFDQLVDLATGDRYEPVTVFAKVSV